MRPPSPTKGSMELSDETTRTMTIERLQEHLELDIQGSKATTEMALEVLLHAASTGQSIEASCAELVGTADSNTLREYLNEQFDKDNLAALEEQVNSALSADIPKKLCSRPRELALDLHDQAFYGKDPNLLDFSCRGQAKAGTTYFFRPWRAKDDAKGSKGDLRNCFRAAPDEANRVGVAADRASKSSRRHSQQPLPRPRLCQHPALSVSA